MHCACVAGTIISTAMHCAYVASFTIYNMMLVYVLVYASTLWNGNSKQRMIVVAAKNLANNVVQVERLILLCFKA